MKQEGDRIYGRGTADNKGQHTINLAALEAVLRTRGKLGFNLKVLLETGEEMGSPGLQEFCEAHKAELKPYVQSKGTIQFSADEPLPSALVTKLVKARVAELED